MVSPLTEKAPLEIVADPTLIDALPVFDTVAVCDTFFPTVTLPKLKVAGET